MKNLYIFVVYICLYILVRNYYISYFYYIQILIKKSFMKQYISHINYIIYI